MSSDAPFESDEDFYRRLIRFAVIETHAFTHQQMLEILTCHERVSKDERSRICYNSCISMGWTPQEAYWISYVEETVETSLYPIATHIQSHCSGRSRSQEPTLIQNLTDAEHNTIIDAPTGGLMQPHHIQAQSQTRGLQEIETTYGPARQHSAQPRILQPGRFAYADLAATNLKQVAAATPETWAQQGTTQQQLMVNSQSQHRLEHRGPVPGNPEQRTDSSTLPLHRVAEGDRIARGPKTLTFRPIAPRPPEPEQLPTGEPDHDELMKRIGKEDRYVGPPTRPSRNTMPSKLVGAWAICTARQPSVVDGGRGPPPPAPTRHHDESHKL